MKILKEKNLKKISDINKKIYVDPGHGGKDPGATGNGMIEKIVNLRMANALREILEYLGAEVKMSRKSNNTYKTIKERADEALKWGADLFISVHNNAGGGDGFEAIHTIFIDHSIGDEVAHSIGKAITGYTNQNLRRIFSKENSKGRDWFGINRLTGSIPSVITEGAFLDSEDHKIIDTPEEQKEFGYVIGIGIANYYKTISKYTPKNDKIDLIIDEAIIFLKNIKEILGKG